MTIQEYEQKLNELGLKAKQDTGEMFRLSFRRLTDKVVNKEVIVRAGEPWILLCRFGVKKGVKGVDPTRRLYDIENGYITVYSMEPNDRGFKRIKLDSIIAVAGKDARP